MTSYDAYNFASKNTVFGSPHGLPWVTSPVPFLNQKVSENRHLEWPQPAPTAWYGSLFRPPTNPTSARTVRGECLAHILRNNVCAGDFSCQLGALSLAYPQAVDEKSVSRAQPRQFAIGQQLERHCVASAVNSFFSLSPSPGLA
jgi:hypothetical protein